MRQLKQEIKVEMVYESVSKEEEEWRLKKLFEILLEADLKVFNKDKVKDRKDKNGKI